MPLKTHHCDSDWQCGDKQLVGINTSVTPIDLSIGDDIQKRQMINHPCFFSCIITKLRGLRDLIFHEKDRRAKGEALFFKCVNCPVGLNRRTDSLAIRTEQENKM